MNSDKSNQFDITESKPTLPTTQPEQNHLFYLTPLINLYKHSAFKKGFGKNQRNYETFALQYCQFLIKQNLPVAQTSFDAFMSECLANHQDKSISYVGKIKSYVKKFFRFCQNNNVLRVLPDPAKRQLVANKMVEAYLANAQIKTSSQRSYRNALNAFFKFLEERDLSFDYGAAMSYLSMMDADELSPHTVSFYISCLRNFTKFIRSKHQQFDIPADSLHALEAIENIKSPKLGNKKYYKDPLIVEERNRLLDIHITPSPIYRVVWSLMAHSGLRVGEVQKLKVFDLDFVANTIGVIGKGQDTVEKVHLFQQTKLHAQLYLSSENAPTKGFLFPELQGDAGYRKIRGEFQKSLEAMGLSHEEQFRQRRKITIHSLRHTCAQIMYEQGNSIEVIQMQLRHASIENTMVYANKVIRETFFKKIKE